MTEINPNTKHKSQTIECPNCGTEIEISEVLSSQLEKDLRKTLQQENESKLKSAVSKAEQDALKKSSLELKDLENQLEEREKESLSLRKQTRELEAQKAAMDDEIARQVIEQKKAIQAELSAKLKESIEAEKSVELEDLKSQLEDKHKNLLKAQELELALRNEEWKVYLNSRSQRQFQLVRSGWIGDYNDASNFLDLFRSDVGTMNPAGWKTQITMA